MAQSNERGHEAPAWPIAIVATLGMSVSYVDRQTLAAIAPSVTKSLGIDNTRYGFLLSAFSIAYLIGAPLAGVLGEPHVNVLMLNRQLDGASAKSAT